MSQFNFIKGLLEEAEDQDAQIVFEGADVSALTRSTFFKTIKTKKADLADALEGFWGRVDFIEFAYAALDSVKLKKGKFKDMDKATMEALEKLVMLHNKLFTDIAKKTEKLGTKYKSTMSSNTGSAAHGRAAERDWVNNM